MIKKLIKLLRSEKRIVSKLLKISNPNFDSTNWRLECRLCQNFKVLSFIVSEKYDVKERDDRAGPDRFMMEIDSTFKKKKNGFYQIILRPFWRILAHWFDFPYDVRRNSLATSGASLANTKTNKKNFG